MMEHFGNELTTAVYLIDAANSGKIILCVLSEDTDVFVLLVWWVHLGEMECKMQIARWDIHALSNCDMISYPYAKAKIKALNT